ncbi:MAG: hypothetical protein A4E28_00984 [Methanocella sp. PtaU1.Bin125]|nr:MAG: hypothetical protein A4E28_00984 [Methanocella sp. PtaU1.Bin125]
MERSKQLLIAAAAAAIVVLLGALAVSYQSLQAAQDELKQYKEQQRQTALAVMAVHMQDMQAARSWWISAHQDEYRQLQQDGITVEADFIDTEHYTAVLDPANPYQVSIGPPGNAEPGELIIGLGQYYADNMTRASGWSASYRLNATTQEVAGFTASLAESIAYDHYVDSLSGGVYNNLGVSPSAILGFSAVTLDTSYLPETGTWLDVTEYRYNLRNTDVPVYLEIKTYVNGSTGEVTATEVSPPYYSTRAPIIH